MDKLDALISELFKARRAWKLVDLEMELALGGVRYYSNRDLCRDLRKLGYVSSSDGRVNTWHRPGEKVGLAQKVSAGELLAVVEQLVEGKAEIGMAEFAGQVRAAFGSREIPTNMAQTLMLRRGWADKTVESATGKERKWVKQA